jgi:hypothetical protein
MFLHIFFSLNLLLLCVCAQRTFSQLPGLPGGPEGSHK